jgi:hypothetical protein
MMQLRHDQRILDTVDDRPMGAAALLEFIDAARPAWHARAACRGQHDVMFPGRGQSFVPAMRLCAACPVAAECRQAGRSEHDGVWGGVVKDRQAGRKNVSAAVQDAVIDWFKANPGWHRMDAVIDGCAWMGKHDRTIQNAVRVLADSGFIKISGKGRRTGSISAPTYALREDK